MDFDAGIIDIKPLTDYWGPFAFDISEAIPEGDTLTAACTVTAHPDGGGDAITGLIESGAISVAAAIISLRLQYPGAAYHGLIELHFNLVLTSGAKHTLVYRLVRVGA